eukprot:scaffold4502_cov19-Tisochrysis_lutea.AAC.1
MPLSAPSRMPRMPSVPRQGCQGCLRCPVKDAKDTFGIQSRMPRMPSVPSQGCPSVPIKPYLQALWGCCVCQGWCESMPPVMLLTNTSASPVAALLTHR